MSGTKNTMHEWMDLHRLQEYAAVSERTLRSWIHSSDHPLPACRVGGKILVKRSGFDSWMEKHRIKSFGSDTVNQIVEELLAGVGR